MKWRLLSMIHLKKLRLLITLAVLLSCSLLAAAQDKPHEVAERFFQSVGAEDYQTSWSVLNKNSQDYFVAEVAKGDNLSPASVQKLFDTNDPAIRSGFWSSFRDASKSADIAKTATYKTVSASGNSAIVLMQVNSRELKLTMKDEAGWKLDYKASFIK